MKTLLVIGAGRLQLPAYDRARRRGLRIVAVDRDPNAPGMALADVAAPVDTTDEAAVLAVARAERIDGVVTLCTDRPVRVLARVAAELGLPGLGVEAALNATHKGRMRDAWERAGVPVPRYRRVGSLAEARAALDHVGLPAIVKTPESAGSRGIHAVHQADGLDGAYAHSVQYSAGGRGEVLVEELVDGPEVSVETLSFDGHHEVVAITDKRTTGHPYFVELGHVEPSRLDPAVQAEIRAATLAALAGLGIMNSAGHVEIKATSRGPRLIEMGARLGGDFISTELVRLSTGVDMVEAILDIALGQPVDARPRFQRGAAIRYLDAAPGRVIEVRGVQDALRMPGVERLEVDYAPGGVVPAVRSSLDRPGFVICDAPDAATAEARARAAAAAVEVRTERLA